MAKGKAKQQPLALVSGSAADELRAFVGRIEQLEEEKSVIAEDIKSIYAEAKDGGFDTRALREVIRLRKQDAEERRAHAAIVETYMHALGMLSDTPLGVASIARATEGFRAIGDVVPPV